MNKQLEVSEGDIEENESQLISTVLSYSPEEYRKEIATLDLTKEQEDEFLETLWRIMSTIVDLGWGVESVQYFLPELFEKASQDSVKLLNEEKGEI